MVTITATVSAVSVVTVSQAVVTLQFTVTETDPYLSRVSAVVAWGDGQTVVYPLQVKPLVSPTLQHAYPPGNYFVQITATNASPIPTQALWVSPLAVTLANSGPPASAPVVIGPIFPRINGAPNSASWEFDIGTDNLCIEASLVSILFTNPGERLMRPNFGCGLNRLIFDPNDSALISSAREIITSAIAQYEPRVTLASLQSSQAGTQAVLNATFLSTLNSQSFTIVVPGAVLPGS